MTYGNERLKDGKKVQLNEFWEVRLGGMYACVGDSDDFIDLRISRRPRGEPFRSIEAAMSAARRWADATGLSVDAFSVEHVTHESVETVTRTLIRPFAISAA